MNGDLKNGGMSCGNGFINSHSISKWNESIPLNYMDGDIENGDVSGGHCFMNTHTLSETKKRIYLDYTEKRHGNVSNVSEMEDTG